MCSTSKNIKIKESNDQTHRKVYRFSTKLEGMVLDGDYKKRIKCYQKDE